MDKNKAKINELIVDIFDNIMYIEEKSLKVKEFSDLSITEFHTINAIGYNKARTMTEVAKVLRITVGTLTTAINRLVKKGYVSRKREENDRRIVKIFLTQSGRLAYKFHEKFHIDMVTNMVKDLTLQEQNIIVKSLSDIKDFLHSQYKL